MAAGGYFVARQQLAPPPPIRTTWFAPYVDVTLTPTYQFQSSQADPARQAVLGFVVARTGSGGCTPSWGDAYTMTQASQSLALGSRIAQLQQEGAQAVVSFGGQSHTSLDVACADTARLAAAYQSVISAYHLTTIDLDIEGTALDDFAAGQRRAAAVAALQQAAAAGHRQLGVWLTLPVETDGLQDNAVSVVESMLRARVSLAGIDLLAMDFRTPPAAGHTMEGEVESALKAVHGQLAGLLPRYGLSLTSQQIWQRLGATVMVGQNDVPGERYTVADAAALAGFARASHLGRVSTWSLNRDSQCGSSFAEVGVRSNTCSGTTQSGLQFTKTFDQMQGQAAVSAAAGGNVLPPRPDTDPADAPYPQWNPSATYQTGYKVTEDGQIYQAKWYNTGSDPAGAVQYGYQTPWELLGPVLPGSHAPAMPALSAGTYPQWTAQTTYKAGDKVLYGGLPYQARWASQGASPQGQASDPSGSPWKALYTIPGEPAS